MENPHPCCSWQKKSSSYTAQITQNSFLLQAIDCPGIPQLADLTRHQVRSRACESRVGPLSVVVSTPHDQVENDSGLGERDNIVARLVPGNMCF